jgi:transcription initiation factor TFIID subunit TAF12
VSMTVERADFDDLVTLVTQAPTWEKDRMGGVRVLLRAVAEGMADAPDQILERWTWRRARASRKVQDRRASAEFPEAKRLLGALANSRGHRHEENAAKLVNAALELPVAVGAALLASAEGYTPRATQLIEAARERLGTVQEVAGALAENLPQPKVTSGRSRRRKRRKRKKSGAQQQGQQQQGQQQQAQAPQGQEQQAEPAEAKKPKPRPRKKPAPKAKPASAETPAA